MLVEELKTALPYKEMTTICERITGNTVQIGEVPETRTADLKFMLQIIQN